MSPLAFLQQAIRDGLEKGLKRELVLLAAEDSHALAATGEPDAEPEPDAAPPEAAPRAPTGRYGGWLTRPRALLPLADQVEEAVYNMLEPLRGVHGRPD